MLSMSDGNEPLVGLPMFPGSPMREYFCQVAEFSPGVAVSTLRTPPSYEAWGAPRLGPVPEVGQPDLQLDDQMNKTNALRFDFDFHGVGLDPERQSLQRSRASPTRRHPVPSWRRTTRPGTPTTTEWSGISPRTTELAPTTT